jgi:hypothetical protein
VDGERAEMMRGSLHARVCAGLCESNGKVALQLAGVGSRSYRRALYKAGSVSERDRERPRNGLGPNRTINTNNNNNWAAFARPIFLSPRHRAASPWETA